jgi:hypothetical protein
LNRSIEDVTVEGYRMVARRDRDDGRVCGGVIVYAHEDLASRVTLIEKSADSERVWLIIHADVGPYLVGVWYRPPEPGEIETIKSLESEWEVHNQAALGTILVGDMNVHHTRWLRFSSGNSAEGEILKKFCDDRGLRQVVRQPTRGANLLDLLLTDMEGVGCKVLPKIADHKGLLCTLPLQVPRLAIVTRTVWDFNKADWEGLANVLSKMDWSWLESTDPNSGAQKLTDLILDCARHHIPQRTLREHKSTHPWVNDRVIKLVEAKRAAEGTDREVDCRDRCSAGLLEEYRKYVASERDALRALPRGKKAWWSKSRGLMEKKGKACSIPALRAANGDWVLDNGAKANLFVQTLSSKFTLGAIEENDYTELDVSPLRKQEKLPAVTERCAEDVLKRLNEDSGTGPDILPARILKHCASALARPVQLLTLCILSAGIWPELWLQHWIVPLYKKKNVYSPGNYRGIHLTAQLSKVVERLLKKLYVPYISAISAFGPNQFAYTTGRGARDALAFLLLTWIKALAAGKRVGVYCSDVAGAFDRVPMARLVAKLKSKNLHPQIVKVLASWLRQRSSRVVVGGMRSAVMMLSNMVFQGTVTGPMLWNIFFEDARKALNEYLFEEAVYADDLNGYRIFSSATSDESIKSSIKLCQLELHKWGRANQVTFDPAKESWHILSLTNSAGENFKTLGINFDGALTMADAVAEVVTEAGWKLRTLCRTRRYYCDADLIILYKSHVLSFLEYRTPAVYHATREVLQKLDSVQKRFLSDVGVDEITALMEFNLAPLRTRRDIAMLGMLHRAKLGLGPPQFRELFKPCQGGYQLRDAYEGSGRTALIRRSVWGLVAVYNRLGSGAQSIKIVADFQRYLQERLKKLIAAGNVVQWQSTCSPR